MEFYYAIYRQGHELLVAVCDDNTLEGTFHCAEKGIKLDVKKHFMGKIWGKKKTYCLI